MHHVYNYILRSSRKEIRFSLATSRRVEVRETIYHPQILHLRSFSARKESLLLLLLTIERDNGTIRPRCLPRTTFQGRYSINYLHLLQNRLHAYDQSPARSYLIPLPHSCPSILQTRLSSSLAFARSKSMRIF